MCNFRQKRGWFYVLYFYKSTQIKTQITKTLNGVTCMKNLKHNPVKHMLPVAIYNFDLSYYKTLRRKFDGIPGFICILRFSLVGHANVE